MDSEKMSTTMNRITLFALSMAFFVASCGGGENQEGTQRKATSKSGIVYGGKLDVSEVEKYQTLFPQELHDVVSVHVATQIYDGLFEFDSRDMSVRKDLVSDYEVSDEGTEYTFHLRKGVKFHKDPCFREESQRDLTADDVVFTFQKLCEDRPDNQVFSMTFDGVVEGANAYFNGESESISGVQKVDDHTVKITLTRPNSTFLDVLANPVCMIFPKEAFEQYGTDLKVGSGPFVYDREADTKKDLFLFRYEDYHKKDTLGNQLPYLDTVHFAFVNDKAKQLSMFKNEELDAIHGLPSRQVKSVVKEQISDFASSPPKYILGRTPEMSVHFLEFNMTKELFKDKRIRKALNYAIDRNKIVGQTLNGEAYGPAHNGITPPTFQGYDISKIDGYEFNPEKAKKLLTEAGYPEGEGFPLIKIELNSGGNKNTRIAFEIQEQLKNVLNINVDIEVVSLAKKIEDAQLSEGDIFRSGWLADYPSPKSILVLAYGKDVPQDPEKPSWPNTARYQNEKFDKFYEKGATALSQDTAYKYFMKAEKVLVEDPPFIPLFYSESYRLIRSEVRNFYSNPMKYWDFSIVYMKERKKKSKEKAS